MISPSLHISYKQIAVHSRLCILALAAILLLQSDLRAQLRIVDYNIAELPNTSSMQTVLAAINAESVNGVVKPIDVLVMQELGSGDQDSILSILNGLGNGTYAKGDLGSTTGGGSVGMIYRQATVSLVAQEQAVNTSTNGAARGVMRYTLAPVGYDSSANFYLYASHYKSSNTSSDQSRRAEEAIQLRANSDALGPGKRIIYAGDFNIYTSSEAMWTTLTAGGNGMAIDPVDSVGAWSNNSSFKAVHTQSPVTTARYGGQITGGMDDRFDWQMISAAMNDGEGVAYIPGSYHAFGNNGTHAFNGEITSGTGASSAVLTALAQNSDHIPVVAQYQVPAKMQTSLGTIPSQVIVGSTLTAPVNVTNSAGGTNGNALVASVIGADKLNYTIVASGSSSGNTSGTDFALGSGNTHNFNLSTATAGAKSATFTINATSPQVPNSTQLTNANYSVFSHANASFNSVSDTNTLAINFGTIVEGSGTQQRSFSISNLLTTLNYTAPLDFLSFSAAGNSSILGTNLSLFQNLAAAGSQGFFASLNTSVPGTFSATYTLNFSDDTSIFGAVGGQQLILNVSGIVSAAGPASVTWNAGSGNWNLTSGNWTGGSPTANLYKNGDSVLFNNSATSGVITVQAGGVSPLSTTVNNDASHPYTIQNSAGDLNGIKTGNLVKDGAGTLILSGTNTYSGSTTVTNGILQIMGSHVTGSNYTVEAAGILITNKLRATDSFTLNGTAVIPANGSTQGTSKVESLVIGATGKLNLRDNDLIVGTGSVMAIRDHIKDGLTGLKGITSDMTGYGISTGFAYAAGGDTNLSPLLIGMLSGQSFDSNSVLVKYTLLGDADLDGDTDLNDLGLWSSGYTGDLGVTTNPTTFWTSGDFDYDGDTDLNDLGLWSSTYTGDFNGGPGSLVVNAPNASPEAVAILNSMGFTVIPEPSTLVLAGLGLAGLAITARRRKK